MVLINGEECYSPIKFRDKYISNYGITENGDVYNLITGHRLAEWPGKGIDSYQSVSVFDDNGNKVLLSIHAAVYETITGEYAAKEGYDIDHINGLKWDNRFSNLQKMKHVDNIQKSTLGKRRNKPMQTNISDEAAKEICELLAQGYGVGTICKITGYSQQWVQGILDRDYCTHISKDYVWNIAPKAGVTIPDSVVHGVCKDLLDGKGIRETARKWGIGHTTVAHIRDGKIRNDITSQYNLLDVLNGPKSLDESVVGKVMRWVTHKGEETDIYVTNLGRFFRVGTLAELHPSIQHNDPCVVVSISGKKKRPIPCKKIVAEMFCDNRHGYKDIINIDGNVFNLVSSNLKYISHSAACKANIGLELRRSYDGGENPNAKLSKDDVEAILIMHYNLHISPKSIANQFGITKQAVKKICDGDVWNKEYVKFMKNKIDNDMKYMKTDDLVIKLL